MRTQRKKLVCTAIASILGASNGAIAQGTSMEAGDLGHDRLQEIVVTARKVSESLQSTPVAVTAITAQTLAAAGAVQITDLQRSTPSLATASGGPGGPGVAFLSIRGQVNTNANSASDAAVGTYVDGVYYARPTSGNFGFLDLAQAEILRGPQGTLFGRNTTGGALNLTTVQPDGKLGGHLRVDAGNYSFKKVEGAITIPMVGEEFGIRLAGRYGTRDGYIDNPFTGTEFQDIDESWAGRATLRWAPESLPLTLSVSADAIEFQDDGQGIAVMALNTGLRPLAAAGITTSVADLFAAQGLNPADFLYREDRNFDETYQLPNTQIREINTPSDEAQQRGVSATLDIELGSWALKSITAWRRADSANSQDLDGTPVRFVAFTSRYEQEQRSQELQLSTRFDKLNVIGGLYYFKEDGTEQSLSEGFGAFPPPFGGGNITVDRGTFEAESRAVFAQANYNFTAAWRATVGYRYTWDSRAIERRGLASLQRNICASPIPLTPSGCSLPFDADFSYPAWTAGVDYQVTDDVFLYAKTSRASMAGGFNTRDAPADEQAFAPEQITDAEIGAKLDLLDGRLRTNIAIFHAITKDAQRVTNGLLGSRASQWVQNTGDVETDGVELEVTALPWRGTQISLGASYLDTGYKAGTFTEDRGVPFGGVVDRSDEPIPQAPEWSYNVSVAQELDVAIGVASLRADWAWVDEKAFAPTTANANATAAQRAGVAIANAATTTDAYGLLNARASLRLQNGIEVSLWGRNLLDEEYFTYGFDGYNTLGFATQNQGFPRTYGLQVGYEF